MIPGTYALNHPATPATNSLGISIIIWLSKIRLQIQPTSEGRGVSRGGPNSRDEEALKGYLDAQASGKHSQASEGICPDWALTR